MAFTLSNALAGTVRFITFKGRWQVATIYLRGNELERLVALVQYALAAGLTVEARLTEAKEWKVTMENL